MMVASGRAQSDNARGLGYGLMLLALDFPAKAEGQGRRTGKTAGGITVG